MIKLFDLDENVLIDIYDCLSVVDKRTFKLSCIQIYNIISSNTNGIICCDAKVLQSIRKFYGFSKNQKHSQFHLLNIDQLSSSINRNGERGERGERFMIVEPLNDAIMKKTLFYLSQKVKHHLIFVFDVKNDQSSIVGFDFGTNQKKSFSYSDYFPNFCILNQFCKRFHRRLKQSDKTMKVLVVVDAHNNEHNESFRYGINFVQNLHHPLLEKTDFVLRVDQLNKLTLNQNAHLFNYVSLNENANETFDSNFKLGHQSLWHIQSIRSESKSKPIE